MAGRTIFRPRRESSRPNGDTLADSFGSWHLRAPHGPILALRAASPTLSPTAGTDLSQIRHCPARRVNSRSLW